MADGVLTPAVSVTSAASGLAVAKPSLINSVTGISLVGILPALQLPPAKLCNRLFSSRFSLRNPLAHKGWESHSPPVSN